MNVTAVTNEEIKARIKLFNEWVLLQTESPDQYKITAKTVKDEYIDIILNHRFGSDWVEITRLPRWFFKNES